MKVDAKVGISFPAVRETVDVAPVDPGVKPEAQKETPLQQGTAKPEVPKKEDLENVVDRLNETVKIFNRALQFRVADSGRVIIKVIDEGTGEIIRQIPPEEMLDLYDKVDKMLGLLVDRKV